MRTSRARSCSATRGRIKEQADALGIESGRRRDRRHGRAAGCGALTRPRSTAAPAEGHDAGRARDRCCTTRIYFGMMMVQARRCRRFGRRVSTSPIPDTIRPALQIIGLREGVSRVAGVYCMVLKDRLLFCADATVNIEPTAEELAEIALRPPDMAQYHFDVEPRVAMLSFSNFGSVDHPFAREGGSAPPASSASSARIWSSTARCSPTPRSSPEICETRLPAFAHPRRRQRADLPRPAVRQHRSSWSSGWRGAELIGPILMGMRKPVNVLNHFSTVTEIVNIAAITTVLAGAEV